MAKKDKEKVELTVSNETLLKIIIFGLGTYYFVHILDSLIQPLTLIFISFFLALALNPAVHSIASRLKNQSRIRATAIAYTFVMAILVGFFVLVVPPIFSQMTDFFQEVPDTLSSIQTEDSSLGNFVRRYNLEEKIQNFSNDWANNLGSVEGPIFSTAGKVVVTVVSIITVFVLTFMMLVEGPKWLKLLWNYVPKEQRVRNKLIAHRMYNVVTKFVNGQVIIAAIGAVFAMFTLIIVSTLLNVNVNAVALGGIIFLFGLIPTIGAIINSVIVTITSLVVSPTLAIIMLVYFIVYQQIENATIQPIIQSRGSELTPLLVFVAAIIGLSIGGVLGGFLAIPIAGCIKVLIDEYIKERKNAESSS